MSELKACPFCKCTEIVAGKDYADGGYRVDCLGCFARIKANSLEIAIKEWQSRPIEDGLRADNARLTAELAELRERTRWIPVSERLPEKYTPVLTVYSTRHGSSAHAIRARVEDDKWYSDTDDSLSFTCNVVTHWMPLPEPPEAD